jgi:hypothetical protein
MIELEIQESEAHEALPKIIQFFREHPNSKIQIKFVSQFLRDVFRRRSYYDWRARDWYAKSSGARIKHAVLWETLIDVIHQYNINYLVSTPKHDKRFYYRRHYVN